MTRRSDSQHLMGLNVAVQQQDDEIDRLPARLKELGLDVTEALPKANLSVQLPSVLKRRLVSYATVKSLTTSEVVRRAIESYLTDSK